MGALENIPLTIRGAGSGNYGQAVPLHGGTLVSLHRFNQILEIDTQNQTARVQAGVRLGNLEREARKHGLELRFYPSTWATATVGGFVGGGFGGVGSIQYGTLWDDLIIETQVLAMTENPKLERNLSKAVSLGQMYWCVQIWSGSILSVTSPTITASARVRSKPMIHWS